MYKLFVNNLQVGSYKNLHLMAESLVLYASGIGCATKVVWKGKSLFVESVERYR